MKKVRLFIILIAVAVVAVIIGTVFLFKSKELLDNKIKILDATYMCAQSLEKFYEDDTYEYSFPCIQSTSTFVLFPNGNKMLVVKALEEEKVTIDELIDAGLKVYKEKK